MRIRRLAAHTLMCLVAGLSCLAGCTARPPNHPARPDAARAQEKPVVALPLATRSEVYATNVMAATSHPLATQVALDVMKQGGSAVDAAIAANALLGLVEPTGCGIGGDLFAIVWDPATSRLFGYNGSGRAPRRLTIDLVRGRGFQEVPRSGPLPVTVPGCVDAWCELHERFGAQTLAQCLAPAIHYAREGFAMAPGIALAWARGVELHRQYPGVAEQFTRDGHAPQAGQIWTNPQLAQTYERIARDGRAGFYEGVIPATIEAFMTSQGGVLAADDLHAHRGEWVEPVMATYRGVEVWELPPNGQGIAALQILKIMETFDVAAMGWGSADYVHAFVEAKKLAFADRALLYADPAWRSAPLHELVSHSYAHRRRTQIDMNHAARTAHCGIPPVGTDTIYLTTADASGMMVSLIQSNYRGMGSGMVPAALNADGTVNTHETLGFMLQNRGEQFSMLPDHANALAPLKRPFHTIIPAFLTRHGNPWMSFGVMGGAMQPQGHAQIVMNIIDFGMSLQQAGDAPRIHHDGSTEPAGLGTPMTDGGVLNLESGFPQSTLTELQRRGHRIQPAATPLFGGYQAIRRTAFGTWEGASESRKDGHAAGW